MALTLPGIRSLFDRGGGRMYAGEPVTQLEHALQTAHSAERAGADAALVTAALLHDLGHLINDQGETPTARGIDDVHQYAALPFLRPLERSRRSIDERAAPESPRLHHGGAPIMCMGGSSNGDSIRFE